MQESMECAKVYSKTFHVIFWADVELEIISIVNNELGFTIYYVIYGDLWRVQI